jgi:hypothetical protein
MLGLKSQVGRALAMKGIEMKDFLMRLSFGMAWVINKIMTTFISTEKFGDIYKKFYETGYTYENYNKFMEHLKERDKIGYFILYYGPLISLLLLVLIFILPSQPTIAV